MKAEMKIEGHASPELRIGKPTVTYTRSGIPTWRVEIWHKGLNRHRVLKASDSSELEVKTSLQATDWEKRWRTIQSRDTGKEQAAERTEQVRMDLKGLDETLRNGLSTSPTIPWEQMKDNQPFAKMLPVQPQRPRHPAKPDRKAARFEVWPSLFDKLFRPSKILNMQAEAGNRWRKAEADWRGRVRSLDAAYEGACRDFDRAQDAWHADEAKYEEKQRRANAAIDTQRACYEKGELTAVQWYFERALSTSTYPDWMPQEFDLEFRKDSKVLLVSYSLPALDAMPRLREVTFIASRDEMREKNLTDAQARTLYDSVLYQVVLRSVYEVFTADYENTIDSVVFNGYVTAPDRSTGQVATTCILSLHTTRDEFNHLDLANVDPKACFKALKGVGSSKLHSLAAVAPIIDMNREDARFVSSRNVTESLDDSVNLASMDWEEFEHLTRELFETEFRSNGGEVKVTQSSRDGGVDAIAFDPDPIRGGKIVIQAKRYTNTVGVAAVRDLYGTVMNEGATKGILVTTSDYGPDAYRFAKDKPLTLMNGANLLHLLEKHGHRAHIDLAKV